MTQSDATPQSWDEVWEAEDEPVEGPEEQPGDPEDAAVDEEVDVEADLEVTGEDDPEPDLTEGAETEALEVDPDTEATEPATEAEAEDATAEEPTAEEAVQTDASDAVESGEPQTFSFRAYGKEHTVDGATVVEEDGQRIIRIPEETFQSQIHPRIGDGEALQRERQQFKQELAKLDPERNETVVRAKTILDVLDPMLEKAIKGDPSDLYDWLENIPQNAELLQAKAEAAAARSQVTAHEQAQQAEQEEIGQEQVEEYRTALQDGLQEEVTSVLGTDDYDGLGLDAEMLRDQLWSLFERGANVFYAVSEENQDQFPGLEPGLYVDQDFIRSYLTPIADQARRAQEAQQRRSKADKAADANEEALGKKGKKPPTAVSTKGGAAIEESEDEPTNEQEWMESVMTG